MQVTPPLTIREKLLVEILPGFADTAEKWHSLE
jgi:hypothetical protein